MKQLLLFILIFISSVVIAQKTIDTTRKPVITEIGKPFGDIVSEKIDSRGGMIKSPDGRLELIFPAGALKNETTISIQACSNTMPSGVGTAYKLEPSGTLFAQPVKAIMHYNEKELNRNSPGLLSLALQNDEGRWSQPKSITLDTIGKTLTGYIRHFSYLAQVFSAYIDPQSAILKVNEKLDLIVWGFTKLDPGDIDADAWLERYIQQLYYTTKAPPIWKANDVINGDAVSGTLSDLFASAGGAFATYQAPAKIPPVNPVAVTAELFFTPDNSGTELKGGQWAHREILYSNITIIEDAYRFTYIHKNFAGCFHYVDSSSCIVNLNKQVPELLNITNYKPWSDWDPCTKCNYQWLNKEDFKANVEIWGMQNSKLIPASKEKPMTEIYIGLLPAFGNTPGQKVICPKQRAPVVMPSMALPADPKYIHFETDGNDIIVHYLGESGKNMISKKVKNEETIIKITKL